MKENIYLGGWEAYFSNNEDLLDFIIQHKLNRKDFEVFMKIQSGVEIITEEGKILEVLNQPGDIRVSGPLDFIIPKTTTNKLFWLK